MKIVTSNRRAYREYEILEKMEAGIVLQGTEVKSLRSGKASLQDSYARIEDNELFLHNMHISIYEAANRYNHPEKRRRKLLMRRQEINWLESKIERRGLTLIPLQVYFSDKGLVKIQLGLARGKKMYDRRQDIAKRDAKRDVQRALRERNRQGSNSN